MNQGGLGLRMSGLAGFMICGWGFTALGLRPGRCKKMGYYLWDLLLLQLLASLTGIARW